MRRKHRNHGSSGQNRRERQRHPDPELAYYQNAWIALGMIRDAIEEVGPVGVLPSSEAVLMLYGPEPVHEAEALIEGIMKIAVKR